MPGNDRPHGARRRPGSKKGPQVGTGGHRRKALEGRGPTPKAEDRPYHPKHKAKLRAEAKAAAAQPTRERQLEKIRNRFDVPADHEIICGRNACAEAARARVPVTRVFMAVSAENDDRLGAVVRRATLEGAPVFEVTKLELEALTQGAVHQGVAMEIAAYDYADALELLDRVSATGRKPLFVALVSYPQGSESAWNLGSARTLAVHSPRKRLRGAGCLVRPPRVRRSK